MATLAELNLERGMPTSDRALAHLQAQMRRYAKSKDVCLLLIHGYGSSGTGGVIRERVRAYLAAQKRAGKVARVVYGEDFSIFDADSRALRAKYPGLSSCIDRGNPGITIVEL